MSTIIDRLNRESDRPFEQVSRHSYMTSQHLFRISASDLIDYYGSYSLLMSGSLGSGLHDG